MKRNNQTVYFILTGLVLLINLLYGFDKSKLVYKKSIQIFSPYLQASIDGSTSSDTLSVWIYFTDKDIFTIDEYVSAKDSAEKRMNPRTRWRRAKVNRENADFSDIPVCRDYVSKVLLYGAKLRTTSKWLNAISVSIPVDSLHLLAQLKFVYKIDLVLKFKLSPEISKSHIPSGLTKDTFTPAATLNYGQSYDQLNQINVIAAHEAGYAGQNVYVLILDTGFFKDHEAIHKDQIIAERDFINNDDNTQDEPGDTVSQHSHGTYCMSALGGSMDSKHYGPAYESNFLLAKTECVAYEREIEEDWFVAALEWGDSLGADVASASLGYIDWYEFSDLNGDSAVTTIAVEQTYKNGIVCVSAAGNENGTNWGHIIAPADAEHVISVGAVDTNGVISSFSSRGPTYDGRIKPEVVARGVYTHCALAGGQTSYDYKSGTSLSTPLVAGAVAVILSAHPDWTPDMVREAMMMTASNFRNPNNIYGWGLIDVMAAIDYDFNTIKPGDIDFDGRFLVTDIVKLVRIVLGEVNPHEFEFQAADMDDDDAINISDIMILVNKILNDGNGI